MQDKLNFRELPLAEMPRERLFRLGPRSLSDSELLAILLGTGNKKENVLELSRRMIKEHDLMKLSRARISRLKKNLGIGQAKACKLISCFEIARRIACAKNAKNIQIGSAKDIARIMMPEMEGLKKEHLTGIFLDSRKNMIRKETISIGSLDTSVIHPREVFKPAFEESAAAVILVHNHPSGDPMPSPEDIEITKQLLESGKILGIQLVDHIVIGDKSYASIIDLI